MSRLKRHHKTILLLLMLRSPLGDITDRLTANGWRKIDAAYILLCQNSWDEQSKRRLLMQSILNHL